MSAFEETRQSVLRELSDAVYDVRRQVDLVLQDITECEKDPNRWPPYLSSHGSNIGKMLDKAERIGSRYHNIIDLHRMPQDHGDAAITRALKKVGWAFYAGGYVWKSTYTYWTGANHLMIDITVSEETGRLMVVYYGGSYGDPVWTLVDPTAGEVLEKLGMELPIE